MSAPLHALSHALRSSAPALGAWICMPGVHPLRTIVQSSKHLSWVCLDCEHGLIPLQPGAGDLIASLPTIRGSNDGPVSAIVRIPATGGSDSVGWQIKYALDAGARGIIVPMVSTKDHALTVARSARFPPVGIRGFGSPFTHTTWGMDAAKEYFAVASNPPEQGGIVVAVQIETKEGVQNLRDIASVPGVDVLFIGPYDLSLSLGLPVPSPDPHPDAEKVIQDILKVSHELGKKCAIFCTSGAQAAKRVKEGFDMINVTTDTGALAEGIASQLAAAAGEA